MTKYSCLLIVLAAVVTSAHSGFLGSPVGYSSGFSGSPLPFAAPAPAHFANTAYSSPLPVAPFNVNSYAASSHHTYASSAPHAAAVNFNSGFNPFRTYASGPSFTKYALPGHIPSVYSRGPLPYDFHSSAVDYSDWEAPNAVFKFPSPVESYDGGWDAPNAVVKFAAPVAPIAAYNGWKSPRTVVKFGPPTTTTTNTYVATGVAAVGAPQAYASPFGGPVGW